MKTINILLDPETRDELYSDTHECLIDFILMEALYNVCNDFASHPENLAAAGSDPEYYTNDPDISIAGSVEYLLQVLKEFDRADGKDVDAEDYNIHEYHGYISDKLCLAISSLTAANKPLDFMPVYDVLNDPGLNRSMTIKGTHLGNTVVMSISGVGSTYL